MIISYSFTGLINKQKQMKKNFFEHDVNTPLAYFIVIFRSIFLKYLLNYDKILNTIFNWLFVKVIMLIRLARKALCSYNSHMKSKKSFWLSNARIYKQRRRIYENVNKLIYWSVNYA